MLNTAYVIFSSKTAAVRAKHQLRRHNLPAIVISRGRGEHEVHLPLADNWSTERCFEAIKSAARA